MPPSKISDDKMRTIRAAVQLGATVDAIQLYREATGCELAEATKAIEQIQAELGTTTPPNRAQYFWFGLFSLVSGSGLLFAGIAMPSKKNPMFPCVVLGGMFALCGIWMLASAALKFSAVSKKPAHGSRRQSQLVFRRRRFGCRFLIQKEFVAASRFSQTHGINHSGKSPFSVAAFFV